MSFSVTFPVGPLFGELGPDPGELLLTEDSGRHCEAQEEINENYTRMSSSDPVSSTQP